MHIHTYVHVCALIPDFLDDPIFAQWKIGLLLKDLYVGSQNRNLSTRTRMLKKGQFFLLVSNLFCVVKRGFVESCKNVPL
jgi:hypothetical protein